MGLHDRKYSDRSGDSDFGEGGGFRRAFRRMFVEGDNFFSWSVPFFRVPASVPGIGGIAVRIHLLYIIFIVATLLTSLSQQRVGIMFTAASMATLFVLVLLHEFGHCLACRKVGGEADNVLMWPLGGLAECRPPHRWTASLVTTLGGPAVNLALVPVLGGVLLALGAGWETLVFNPFSPAAVYASPWFDSYWKVWLWSAYFTNLALLLFNMLLPMFPMDCGRVVQELLWWRIGYRRSMQIATTIGLVAAIVVGTFALFSTPMQSTLFAIALFAGITCYMEKKKLAMMGQLGDGDHPALAGYDFSRGYAGMAGDGDDDKASKKTYEAALKAQQREQARQAEVDRILDKIRREGMGSLTRKEKAALKEETERKKNLSA